MGRGVGTWGGGWFGWPILVVCAVGHGMGDTLVRFVVMGEGQGAGINEGRRDIRQMSHEGRGGGTPPELFRSPASSDPVM